MSRGAALVLAAVALLGCSAPDEPPPAPPAAARPRPNIILILVDTLRADRVGAYAGARRLTPFLDSLAANGVVFEHAYAQSSWTSPSVASLLTSRYQSQHGVTSFASPIAESEVTLAEALQAEGYATAGLVATIVVTGATGFRQGFDYFHMPQVDPGVPKVRAATLNAAAFTWLDATPQRPVFLYLHYLEPHLPYCPPPDVLERVLLGRPRPDPEQASNWMMFSAISPPDAARLRAIEDVYDAEVASFDVGLRGLVAGLQSRGVLRDAVVVITSDHGEELNDHGFLGHGTSLYDELIQVPLVFARSPALARKRVPEVVSLIDVAPTLLDLAGGPPAPTFEGRSLRPLIEPVQRAESWLSALLRRFQAPPPPRIAYSELRRTKETVGVRRRPHELAAIVNRGKIIVGSKGERERYDLARDGTESAPLAADAPGEPPLQAAVDAFHQRTPVVAEAPPALEVTPERRDQLRALGYAHSAISRRGRPPARRRGGGRSAGRCRAGAGGRAGAHRPSARSRAPSGARCRAPGARRSASAR